MAIAMEFTVCTLFVSDQMIMAIAIWKCSYIGSLSLICSNNRLVILKSTQSITQIHVSTIFHRPLSSQAVIHSLFKKKKQLKTEKHIWFKVWFLFVFLFNGNTWLIADICIFIYMCNVLYYLYTILLWSKSFLHTT